MKTIKYILSLAIIALFVFSCQDGFIAPPNPQPEIVPPEPPTAGSADFTKFIAIGNSLTAGFQAGALFNDGQKNSLPVLIHKAMDNLSGDFNQPDINSELGYSSFSDPDNNIYLGRLLLQGNPPQPTPQVSDASAVPSPLNSAFDYTGSTADLNNFGVPGILLGQALIPETGDWSLFQLDPRVNPFYARFASSPGTSTILGDAMATSPTFFMFWLGNNDVLGYAIGGATDADLGIFTSVADFTTQYTGAMQIITGGNTIKGVVANIPSVTDIPFFKAVSYDAVVFDTSDPDDAAKVESLNAGYAAYNAGLDQMVALTIITQEEADRRKISFENGNNPFVMIDEDLTDLTSFNPALVSMRQTEPTDLIPLTAATVLPTGVGTSTPAEDEYVLTPEEVAVIQQRVDDFNAAIESVLSSLSLNDRVALVDVNTAFSDLATAGTIVESGVPLTLSFVPPGGAFSEDGVHPNTRGYAYTANLFIRAINAKFGSTLHELNLGNYPGVALPLP